MLHALLGCLHPRADLCRSGERDLQLFLMALALAATDPPAEPMSVEVIRDPITDHVRAYATVRARRDRLVVSCDSDEGSQPELAFHSERWLARGNVFTGYRPVTYRFDTRRPRRQMWRVDDRHVALTGQARIASFLAYLMASDSLVIRTRDIENHRVDVTFRLIEVRPAVEQVMSACSGRPWSADELQP